jgi:hypothetical protein
VLTPNALSHEHWDDGMKAFTWSRGQAKRAIPATRPSALTSRSFASYSVSSCECSCMRANLPAVIEGKANMRGAATTLVGLVEAFELFAVSLSALLVTYTKGW